jgi:Pyruvate/2-oxoacid:ferredoxin oxidoreductase gamma subunit/NAD-dependent dihydropyrimidine dehydrogenase PreA subunit
MGTRAALRLRDKLAQGEAVDVRGHGKAGGGLVVAIQAFGEALSEDPALDVQDWPLFSSARKGAIVCAYLRTALGSVEDASRVRSPDVALLMNEPVAEFVDFAEGTQGALYLINSAASPEVLAGRMRLSGTVVSIPGDALGMKHLGRPLANVAVLAALAEASGMVEPARARASIEHRFEKRRLPRRMIDANLALFDEALGSYRVAEIPDSPETSHLTPPFAGYGQLPAGAQSRLRTSLSNRTSFYGRSGVAIEFADPAGKCNGCSLCVVQCPEGIVEFTADPARGTLVHGARFADKCKRCRECVAACPLDLFQEVAVVAEPERVEGA